MKKIITIALIASLFLVSCATPKIGGYSSEMSRLYPNMPVKKVYENFGKPSSSSYRDGKTLLTYQHDGASFLGVPWKRGSKTRMTIEAVNGKVIGWR